jgi:Ser/Thr protein kinase RdoA (MazF antagonist)
VKEPFEPKSETELEEEARIQEMARTAGIATPGVVRSVDGSVSMDVGDVRVTVSEWVDMRDRERRIDAAGVGRLLASLHGVPFPELRPEDPWYREPIAGERWGRLASYRDELAAMAELVEPPSVVQTCHRDLWADNVRATSDGGVCVFDWENFGLAHPGQELALVLFEFGDGDAARTRTIHEAYVGGGGPGRVSGRASFSMLIAQIGHIGEAGCIQWLGSGDRPKERERAAAWVGEFLDEPLSRGVIDGILDAVLA